MSVLNANIRAFDSYAESPKLRNSYFVYVFTSYQNSGLLHKTDSTVFILLLGTCTHAHSAHIEWNWNCGLFYLFFFVIIFNSKWLANTRK